MTIAKKLSLYVLLPLVTVLLILGIVFYLRSSAFLEEQGSSMLFSQARAINNEIHLYIQRSKSDSGMLLINRMIMDYFMYSELELLDYAEDARWKIENDFLTAAKEKPEYAAIRLIGLDGISVVDIIDKKISYKHFDFSKEEWFQNTLKLGKDESNVSYLHLCREHKKPGILISKLYFNDVDENKGVGSLHVHVDDFFRNLHERRIGENGYVYLIDKSGAIVAHKDRRKTGMNVKDFKSTRNLLAGGSGTTTEIDETGKILMKKTYMPIEIEGLGLLVAQPMSEILAHGKQVQLFNLVLLIVTVLIVSVITYISTKKIIRPIIEVQNAAVEISRGNLNKRVAVKSRDEIANLAEAFNQMVEIRQESERALSEEKERLSVTLRSIGDAVITTDTKGKISLINKAAEQLTGWSHKAAVGRHLNEVFHIINEKTRERYLNPVDNVIKSGLIVGLTKHTALIAKDSTEKTIADSGAPIRDKDGNVIGVILVFRDITRRKQAENKIREYSESLERKVKERTKDLEEKTEKLGKSEEALRYLLEDANEIRADLEKANKKLKELDILKSMFIASMSHELRTPLNSIIGFTGVILQGMTGEINAEQRDQLQRVSGSAKHLLALITDVIDISKIEAGKVEAYVEEFQLDKIIKEAVSSLKTQIDNKGLSLEINISPQDLRLKSDRERLLQCILNYISNAVKFTEKGYVRISARLSTSQPLNFLTSKKGNFVEISVIDTGIGIKEKDIPKLFNSFVRLDSHLKLTTPGTGLGLYLTKKLVTEVLGGSLSVESRHRHGSTFMLRIPKEL